MKNLKVTIPGTDEKATVPVATSSSQFSISWRDSLLGLLMAVGTPIVTYAYDLIMAWANYQEAHFDVRVAVKYGLSAGVLYIGKNFFQQGKVVINKKELTQ